MPETKTSAKPVLDQYGLDPTSFPTPRDYMEAYEEKYLDEKVLIQLPKDTQNYKDDVSVCINGRIWQIQRGIQVPVPRRVANVIASSAYQEMLAITMSEQKANVHLGDAR